MSGDARAGRGLSTTGLVVILGLMAAGGGAAWTLLGSEVGSTEGVARTPGEAPATPSAPTAPSIALDLAPVASQALAGAPVLLRVHGRDEATGAPAAGRALPPDTTIVLDGVDPTGVTVSAGFQVDGDRIVPGAGLRLDEQGSALLAVHGAAAANGTLRLMIGGREVAASAVAWTAPPERFVVLLPGQSLDDRGEVRGVVRDLRVGEAFSVEIVPIAAGREATFAGAYQGSLALGESALQTVTVCGARTAVTVAAAAPAAAARVEVQLPAGLARSTAFRVVPAEGN